MKIGILVFSETGNTLSVAERLLEKYKADGHEAVIDRITVKGVARAGAPAPLDNRPDPSGFDAVVFAAPVQAFSLAQAMKAYLGQVESLSGKPVALFTTQHLKRPWLGGNHAIRQMSAACTAKGGKLCGTGIVNWSRPDREDLIAKVVDDLGKAFARE